MGVCVHGEIEGRRRKRRGNHNGRKYRFQRSVMGEKEKKKEREKERDMQIDAIASAEHK